MAAKRMWLLRLPEVRQEVAALDVPVVDRILFERLFHVRRRPFNLMHTFGGYQTGQALLIERAELLRQLEGLEAGAEFAIEQRRRQRRPAWNQKLNTNQKRMHGSANGNGRP